MTRGQPPKEKGITAECHRAVSTGQQPPQPRQRPSSHLPLQCISAQHLRHSVRRTSLSTGAAEPDTQTAGEGEEQGGNDAARGAQGQPPKGKGITPSGTVRCQPGNDPHNPDRDPQTPQAAVSP